MGIRTKLLLALAAVAIGAAGAAIYLSVEANRTSASQEELVELRGQVEALQEQLGVTPTTGELDAATDEIEEAEGAAEDAAEEAEDAAGAAEGAAGDAEGAAGAAGAARSGAEAAEGDAARDANEADRAAGDAAAAEDAIRNRTEPAPGAPPLPEIGTNGR